ncbi:MAG: prolyl oligopeptidase family serine peptidase [Chitinophagales bacterium]
MSRFTLYLALLISNSIFAKNNKAGNALSYPVTNKISHSDTYFGTTVEDPYQWLENDTSAETAAWVAAENKVTFDYLSKIPYREVIRKRFNELYNYTKISLPQYSGDYIFFKKKEGLQNQPVIYVQKTLTGTPIILADPNAYDPSGLTSISINSVSTDNRYVVLEYSVAGSDWHYFRVFDLLTKSYLEDKIEWIKSTYAAWYKDGFYYSRYDKPSGSMLSQINSNEKVYFHQLGTAQANDRLVYSNLQDSLVKPSLLLSDDLTYQFLYLFKGTYGYEVYWKKTADSGYNFKPLFTGFDYESNVLDVINDKFIVQTNNGAPNGKLVQVDPNNPDKSNWREILPEQKSVLESVTLTGFKITAVYLENACNKMYVFDINGKNKKEIALPGPGTISISGGKREEHLIFYNYYSFTYPSSVFVYNTLTGYSQLFMKTDVKFNPSDFESKQEWYKSKDGTKIPMFIVYKKGLKLDKKNPTYLYSYGGFNINMTPYFSIGLILLLENGGVYAMPNIRGGGEYGEEWHQAGMLTKKQNVFDDFIAAAEYLIKKKYTSKEKLAIAGRSNGGLLVGACMTQRPDLYKVAFPGVGVMDMLRFQKFTVGHGWVTEFGSSDQSKEMFEYLKGYSPYHNLKPNTKYPATLVQTADHDDRVVPAHSFKFAARLQEYATKDNPELIRIETNAGHGDGKPTSKIIEDLTDHWSFFFWNMGLKTLSFPYNYKN